MPAALDLQQLVPPDVLYDVPLENDGILKQDCGLAVSVGLGEQNGLMKRSTCTEEQIPMPSTRLVGINRVVLQPTMTASSS
jgi:hypothetical protein